MSGQLQRLARRLGKSPDDLAAKIDADVIRRTKYPVIVEENPDGTITYRDPKVPTSFEEGREANTTGSVPVRS
jgi:hypothetical protein